VVIFEDRATLGATDQQIYDITSIEQPLLSIWSEIRPILPSLFGTVGIEFHDIGHIGGTAETNAQLYIDYCHLSPQGAQRAADLMYPAVVRRVESWLAHQDHEN
jgi:hypothetical protein